MSSTSKAWRYLLRDGRFITASVQLAQKHLFQYVTREGVVVFALLSSAAEKLLMQLVDLSKITIDNPSVTGQCCISDVSLTTDGVAVKTQALAHQ